MLKQEISLLPRAFLSQVRFLTRFSEMCLKVKYALLLLLTVNSPCWTRHNFTIVRTKWEKDTDGGGKLKMRIISS